MRLIGKKGTIDFLDSGRLQITDNKGNKKIAPASDLAKYIKEFEIHTTEDGMIQGGKWE
jgi:hypothetical protein